LGRSRDQPEGHARTEETVTKRPESAAPRGTVRAPPGMAVHGTVTSGVMPLDVPADLILASPGDGLEYPWKCHSKIVPDLEDSSGPRCLTRS
jgi:hypothetical protein